MCGEIQDYQKASTIAVRLTSAGVQTISLPFKFNSVEEIRLDEFMITNFNGGVSGGFYLKLELNGLSTVCLNNTGRSGTLLSMDVLNPKTVYQRPVSLIQAGLTAVTQFQIGLENSNGTATTFNEAIFHFTIVYRKSDSEMAEMRALKQLSYYPPSQIQPRVSWNPYEK